MKNIILPLLLEGFTKNRPEDWRIMKKRYSRQADVCKKLFSNLRKRTVRKVKRNLGSFYRAPSCPEIPEM